jgi:hypothetical protein
MQMWHDIKEIWLKSSYHQVQDLPISVERISIRLENQKLTPVVELFR